MTDANRTIAVLSPDYINAQYTQPEWAAAFAQDPMGEKGTLLPIRVKPFEAKGLINQIVYIDVWELDEPSAKAALLTGVVQGRVKPQVSPCFPGKRGHTKPRHSVKKPPVYPGKPFSLTLTIITPDKLKKLSCLINKKINRENLPFYEISYGLSERKTLADDFQYKVTIKAKIKKDRRLEDIVFRGLSSEQTRLLLERILPRLEELAGKPDVTEDRQIDTLTNRMLDIKSESQG
jgi:hypothetical protein